MTVWGAELCRSCLSCVARSPALAHGLDPGLRMVRTLHGACCCSWKMAAGIVKGAFEIATVAFGSEASTTGVHDVGFK